MDIRPQNWQQQAKSGRKKNDISTCFGGPATIHSWFMDQLSSLLLSPSLIYLEENTEDVNHVRGAEPVFCGGRHCLDPRIREIVVVVRHGGGRRRCAPTSVAVQLGTERPYLHETVAGNLGTVFQSEALKGQ
jgi:hypothetical protein